MKSLSLALLVLLTSSVWAGPSLDGKEVFLIISQQRHDLDGEWMELAIRGLRHEIGMDAEELPVIRMGIADSDAKEEHFQRLGLNQDDIPALCVVQWSEQAKNGPKKILKGQLLRQVTRAKGLKAPKKLFRDWLIQHGKSDLADKLVEPEIVADPSPSPIEPGPSEQIIEMSPAEVALAERRYPEAIELARISGESLIENEAKQAFHQQGALALAEDKPQLALSVYQKLSAFYPEDSLFKAKVEDLTRKPEAAIIGRWKMTSSSGWAEFTAQADGELTGKGGLYLIPVTVKLGGHWLLTGDTERTFQLHWTNGNLYNIRVHENLETFEGHELKNGPVSGQRLE